MQLKVHVLEQMFNPRMDETYQAISVSGYTAEDVFFGMPYAGLDVSLANILFTYPFVIVIALLIVMAILASLHLFKSIEINSKR